MATLVDHTNKSITKGAVENLTELMVTAQMSASTFRPKARERHAQAVVRSAIRRGGRTDAGQEMVMDDQERAAWDAANPLEG